MRTFICTFLFLACFCFCINYATSMEQKNRFNPSCIDETIINNAFERLNQNDLEGALAELHYAIDARKNSFNPFDPEVLEALEMQEFRR